MTTTDKYAKAAAALTGNTAIHAGARCIIKRHLNLLNEDFDDTPKYLARVFVDNPDRFAAQIQLAIKRHARAWEEGNNSRNPRVLEQKNAESDRYQTQVAQLMSAIGVTLDWPGLYPTYQYGGRTYYELCDLFAAMD